MKTTQQGIEFSNFEDFMAFLNFVDLKRMHLQSDSRYLILGDDLRNGSGAILCKKGKHIDEHLYNQLRVNAANSSKTSLSIHLARSDDIFKLLKDIIFGNIEETITSHSLKNKDGVLLLQSYKVHLLQISNAAITDNIVYALLKYCFVGKTAAKFSNAVRNLLQHSLIVAAFAHSQNKSVDECADLFRLALVLCFIQSQIKGDDKLYHQSRAPEVKSKLEWLEKLKDEFCFDETMEKSARFYIRSVLKEDLFFLYQSKEAEHGRVLLVLFFFIEEIPRVMHMRKGNQFIADLLYARSRKGVLPAKEAEDIAYWLQEFDVVHFYESMDKMSAKCEWNSAAPYPMNGFCSPSMFVCSKNELACPHLLRNASKVNIASEIYNLRPGSYSKCGLLTTALREFYGTFYEAIKSNSRKR